MKLCLCNKRPCALVTVPGVETCTISARLCVPSDRAIATNKHSSTLSLSQCIVAGNVGRLGEKSAYGTGMEIEVLNYNTLAL